MFKSYTSSYTYSSDGKKEISEYNTSLKDNQNDMSIGLKRDLNLESNNKKEMFYKSKMNPNESRKIYGKSKNNSDWETQNIINDNLESLNNEEYEKYEKYFNKLNRISSNPYEDLNNPNMIQPTKIQEVENTMELNEYQPINTQNNSIGNMLNPRDFSLVKPKRRPIKGDMPNMSLDSFFNDDFFNF
jgi:hypothetical protein